MEGINISQPIVNNAVDENYDALPNIDAIYGPYPNLNGAITTIMASKRAKGLTVGIMTDNGIEEYWFKNGITNNHLVPKNQGGSGGGHNLFITNNVTEDTNTNLQALFPTTQVKDVIVDATLGGVYIYVIKLINGLNLMVQFLLMPLLLLQKLERLECCQ